MSFTCRYASEETWTQQQFALFYAPVGPSSSISTQVEARGTTKAQCILHQNQVYNGCRRRTRPPLFTCGSSSSGLCPYPSPNTIIGTFAGVSFFVIALVWLTSGRLSSKLLKIDRLLMCWWAFTELVHMIVEGYVAFSPECYKNKTGFILAEIWKEYCKGDSRYAAREPSVIYVEGITSLLECPLSLLNVYTIATKKPYRHMLQLVTSLGQLHGTLVYLLYALFSGYKVTHHQESNLSQSFDVCPSEHLG